MQWWQESVFYQIYPRSFCDSNSDGIGDIKGIISRLDYIESLGVGAIWLSPVYCSPNDDNGYDISDYCDINPEFGSMEDMDRLIELAKAKNIAIIMDLVINHTSDEHEWFRKSREKIEPYTDYYIWKKGRGKNNTLPPNNWTSFFAGGCWQFDDVRGEYFLHLFSPKQPDLNWENPLVYEEIKKIMEFWLDKGISGFRCDVINVIAKSSLANGKKHIALTGKEHYISRPQCHELLKRFRSEVWDKYGAFTVGETVLVNTCMANDLMNANRKELDLVFGFEHMETDQIGNKWFKTSFKPKKFKKVIAKWQNNLDWNANYLENHDQPRSVSRFGNDKEFRALSSKMLLLFTLTLKGTPFIFEGQEIGMTNGDFQNLDEILDIESHNVDKMAQHLPISKKQRWRLISKTSRDNARTPMQWSHSANGGFSSATPWLKVNSNYSEINVENSEKDNNSILHFFRKIVNFRKSHREIVCGSWELLPTKGDVIAYKRTLDNTSVIIACNFSSKIVKIELPKQILLSNYENKVADDTLLPYEGAIFLCDN